MASPPAPPIAPPHCPGLHCLRAPQLFRIYKTALGIQSPMTYNGLSEDAQDLFKLTAFQAMKTVHELWNTETNKVMAHAATQLGIDMLQAQLGIFCIEMVDGSLALVLENGSMDVIKARTKTIAALAVKIFMAINHKTQHRAAEAIPNMMQLTSNSLGAFGHYPSERRRLDQKTFDFCADVFRRFMRVLGSLEAAEIDYLNESLWVACDGSLDLEALKLLCV